MLSKDIQLVLGATVQVSWQTLRIASQVIKKHTDSSAPWIRKDRFADGYDFNHRLYKELPKVDIGKIYARAENRERMQHTFRSEQEALEVLSSSQDDDELRLALSRTVAAKRLEQNLYMATYLQCFDPKDRVFALLSTTSFDVRFITPSYEKSVSKVYWESAAAISFWTLEFLRSAGLGGFAPDVIAKAEAEANTTDVPSWVPNWQLVHNLPAMSQRFFGKFSASGDETNMTEILDDGWTLDVGGFAVDSIESVLPKPFGDGHKDVLNAFRCTSRKWRARKEERRQRLRKLIRTCTTDTDTSGRRLSEETVDGWIKGSFLSLYEESDYEDDEEDDEDEDEDGDSDAYDDDDDSGGEIGGYSRFIDGTASFHKAKKQEGKNFLRTCDGRMALGPSGALPGDIVVILYQCSVPLLLRIDTDPKYFKLVGECYVHGLMDGEALKCGKGVRTFKIR